MSCVFGDRNERPALEYSVETGLENGQMNRIKNSSQSKFADEQINFR